MRNKEILDDYLKVLEWMKHTYNLYAFHPVSTENEEQFILSIEKRIRDLRNIVEKLKRQIND